MPNRTLREGILSSDKVCALTWVEEVFYRRLFSIVDDYGRCEANLLILRAKLYPLQVDKVSTEDVGQWMLAAVEAGLCRLYCVNNKSYLQIENFGQKTRSKSKYPEPPDCGQLPTTANNCQQLRTIANNCQQLRTIANNCQQLPTTANNCGQLPTITDNCLQREKEKEKEKEKERSKEKEKEKEIEKERYPTHMHVREVISETTSIEDVLREAEKIAYPMSEQDAQKFIAHYQAMGWRMPSGAKIVNWRPLVAKWKAGRDSFKAQKPKRESSESLEIVDFSKEKGTVV